MNSFQAKIGWRKMRKREIKIIVPFRSVPTQCVIENSKQIAKKLKKLKNTIVVHIKQKYARKGCEREKIKIILPFRSFPWHKKKWQKNSRY